MCPNVPLLREEMHDVFFSKQDVSSHPIKTWLHLLIASKAKQSPISDPLTPLRNWDAVGCFVVVVLFFNCTLSSNLFAPGGPWLPLSSTSFWQTIRLALGSSVTRSFRWNIDTTRNGGLAQVKALGYPLSLRRSPEASCFYDKSWYLFREMLCPLVLRHAWHWSPLMKPEFCRYFQAFFMACEFTEGKDSSSAVFMFPLSSIAAHKNFIKWVSDLNDELLYS